MFRVSLDLTDDELDAYQAIVDRIASTGMSSVGYAGLIATGCVLALSCAALLFATGAIGQGVGAVVTALVFGAYWLGAWAPSIWFWIAARRGTTGNRIHVRRGLDAAVLIVGARRLAMAGRDWRTVMNRTSIHKITSEGGLMLIWRSPDLDIYPFAVVPARRLTPAQQAELAAFGTPHYSGQDNP